MKLYDRHIMDEIRPHYHSPDVLVIQGTREFKKNPGTSFEKLGVKGNNGYGYN